MPDSDASDLLHPRHHLRGRVSTSLPLAAFHGLCFFSWAKLRGKLVKDAGQYTQMTLTVAVISFCPPCSFSDNSHEVCILYLLSWPPFLKVPKCLFLRFFNSFEREHTHQRGEQQAEGG